MTISRRQFGACIGAGIAGLSGIPNASARTRPNILVLLSDDHLFRALGAMGNPRIRTPNLDRLAREGTLFTHCFVSNPICTPSRATMLTGQYGFNNGVTFFGMPIRETSPRWPRLLRDAGYRTAYTGKWHNDGRPGDHGFEQMRHVFLGGMHDYDSIPVVEGPDDTPTRIERNPSDVFTDAALDLIDEFDESPWALMVAYTTPHDPRTPPAEYDAMYPPSSVSLPENFMPAPPFDTGTLDIRDEKLLERPLDPAIVKREIARYYAMITHFDTQIGRILDALDARGQLDNTLILFAGDNGLALGAHGLLGKQTLYEEGVRVPMILRGPGIPPGVRRDDLVDVMDVMPTVCDAAGVDPAPIDGLRLQPIARGESEGRDAIFLHYDDLFRGVRTQRYKYILHLTTGREELFDLHTDPYERANRAADTALATECESLRARLRAWRQAMNDLDDVEA